jgi:hypothetical protein
MTKRYIPGPPDDEKRRAIRRSEADSVTSIIETGWLLTEAKTALDHGEWLPMVESDLPFQRNTAQRLMKIAADSRLANRAHVPLLPPSWGTLYELSVAHRLDLRHHSPRYCSTAAATAASFIVR